MSFKQNVEAKGIVSGFSNKALPTLYITGLVDFTTTEPDVTIKNEIYIHTGIDGSSFTTSQPVLQNRIYRSNGVRWVELSQYNTEGVSVTVSSTGVSYRKGVSVNSNWITTNPEALATIVDASTGTYTETLNPATGSGTVKFWVLQDKTNTATLSVEVGESLNKITNGSFLFSNYEIGTQFQAVDRSTGFWEISVIGTGDVKMLSYLTAKPLSDVGIDSLDSTNNLPINNTIDSAGEQITNNGDGGFTLKTGRYRLLSNLAFTADGGEITNTNFRWYNVTTSSFIGSQSHYVDFSGDSSPKPNDAVAYIDVTTDTVVAVRPTINVDNNISLFQQESWIDIQQIASTEVVLAGMVEPTELNALQASLSTVVNNSGSANYAFDQISYSAGSELSLTGTGSISGLKAGKRYKLTSNLWLAPPSATIGTFATFRFVNLTSGLQIGEQWIMHVGTSTSIIQSSMDGQVAFITPTTDCEVGIDFTGGTVGEIGPNSTFTVEEVPSATVVNPDDVPVEDVKVLLGFGTVGNGGTITISETWGNLASSYESIEFQMIGVVGSPLIPYRFEQTVEATNWVDNTTVIFLSDAVSFHRLTNMDITGNTANVGIAATDNSITQATFNIYGIKSQKTVISSIGDTRLVGDIKTQYANVDALGWVRLDGRLITDLTLNQQVNAASLGFVGNIPNLISSISGANLFVFLDV